MSSADWNKVFGSVMVALLAAVGINVFIDEVTHAKHHEENAYKIVVADSGAGSGAETQQAAKPALEAVGPLLASADVAAGEKDAKKCATCHTFNKGGATKQGPNLWNIINRGIGGVDGFSYSSAMQEHGGAWDYEALNAFLAKPKDYVPGTKMNFAGLRNVQDRADLIAYLRSQADSPAPLP